MRTASALAWDSQYCHDAFAAEEMGILKPMNATLPVLLPFGLTIPLPAQVSHRLTEPIEDYSLQATSFIDGMLKISARFQLPFAIEWVKSASTLKPVQFSQTRTAADVIQSVVTMYPGYDWRMEDGVVHVFQQDLVEDSRNPLNITITEFDQQPETVGWANNNLFQRITHVVRHPELSGISGSVLGGPDEPVFNFAARNVPARSILNKIVTAGLAAGVPHMKRIWVATFPESPVFSRTGYLEAVPMWNPKFVPDDGQPFWVLLAWGESALEKMEK